MTKLNLLDKDTNKLIFDLQDEILELVDNQDEYTRSDLQGRASAIVMQILREGIEIAEK